MAVRTIRIVLIGLLFLPILYSLGAQLNNQLIGNWKFQSVSWNKEFKFYSGEKKKIKYLLENIQYQFDTDSTGVVRLSNSLEVIEKDLTLSFSVDGIIMKVEDDTITYMVELLESGLKVSDKKGDAFFKKELPSHSKSD